MKAAKIIFIISISINIFGCATNYNHEVGECKISPLFEFNPLTADSEKAYYNLCLEKRSQLLKEKEYNDRLINDPDFAKAEEKKKQIENEKILNNELKENQSKIDKENALNYKTPINEVLKHWGEPDLKELHKGDKVFWYDNNALPFYIIFKNDYVYSIYVDKSSIDQRENLKIKDKQHQDWLNESKANRKQQLLLNVLDDKSVTTTCTKDYYGNTRCVSR